MSDAPFCADECRRAGESLAGTASKDGARFVLVERDEPWGRDALASTTLDDSWKDAFEKVSAQVPRTRIAFVRGVGRAPTVPRLWFTSGKARGERLYRIPWPARPEAIDLRAMLLGEVPAGTERVERPLALVCTHGKRDRCCALHGVSLAEALADEDGIEVLQSSHLGGHRFAAVVVTLPDGNSYGHLAEADAAPLAASLRAGHVFDPTRFRGRAGTDEPVQVAEAALVTRGLRSLEGVELRDVTKGPRGVEVVLAQGGSEHRIVVRRHLLSVLRPASCFETPTPAVRFEVE